VGQLSGVFGAMMMVARGLERMYAVRMGWVDDGRLGGPSGVEEDGAERMFGVGGGWVEWPWRHGEAAVDLNLILKD